MSQVKEIKVLSFARLQAVLMAFVGLVAGIFYSFGGFIIDVLVSTGLITTTSTPGVGFGTVLAFLALIGMPIIFAIFGFITGIIGAYLYKSSAGLVVRFLGEMGLDLREMDVLLVFTVLLQIAALASMGLAAGALN